MMQYVDRGSYTAYLNFMAMRTHFTVESFDYNRYNGKVNVSYDQFVTKPDTYHYYKLSKLPDAKNHLIACFSKNPSIWIGDCVSSHGTDLYLERKKRLDSLTHLFTNEIKVLDQDFSKNFEVKEGQYPLLMQYYMSGSLSLETFCILIDIAKIKDYWKDTIYKNVIFRQSLLVPYKYGSFLDYDVKKFRGLVKEHLAA